MIAGRVEETAKPERILLALTEYPGALPTMAAVSDAEKLRLEGNAAYASGDFRQAVRLYSNSAMLNPTDHLVYSNRSACWLELARPIEALDDAEVCIKLVPQFAKGYLRKGAAEQLLRRRVDAQESFRRGLAHDPDSVALQGMLRDLRSEASGDLQDMLYNVLFVSPHLQMDRLFQALEDPESLTAAYVEQHSEALDAQFACLTQTLGVDVGLLASPVLRDAYDRVTFACGQLLQWVPDAVSKHLEQAKRIVDGLGLALRCGWRIHHGVAKFSANALAILATSEGARDDLRREAVRLLLGGMLRWLLDPTPEPDDPPEDRDVCGCTFLSPRLSAATWLERLFEQGTRPWVREECERFPDIVQLVVHLTLVVRDENAMPLGLPCLLRLPGVAAAVMASSSTLDLSTCDRRHGRRSQARAKGKGGAPSVSSPSPPQLLPPATGSAAATPVGDAELQSVDGVTPEWAPASASPLVSDAAPGATGAPLTGNGERLAAPVQRLGEWTMSSLGYLLYFVDDDSLFAAQTCSALRRMALSTPDGVERLTIGLWIGLPLLERLSALACQHAAALDLLQLLARHSSSARAAMCALATSLASAEGRQPEESPTAASGANATGEAEWQAPGEAARARMASFDDEAAILSAGEEDLDESRTAELTWVECFHELRDEVWVEQDRRRQPWDADANELSAPTQAKESAAIGDEGSTASDQAAPSSTLGLMTLGNFEATVAQVPGDSEVRTYLQVAGHDDAEFVVRAVAAPAVWNRRFDDMVDAPLVLSGEDDLGTPAWLAGKESSIVLLARSAIQRSTATPDWASAVWLCAEAGAVAVIVYNDLPDSGPTHNAFRMGLFGSAPPPIQAFMVNGIDGAALSRVFLQAQAHGQSLHALARSVPPAEAEGGTIATPKWPLLLRFGQDIAQAWSLLEMVHRTSPCPRLEAWLEDLAEKMGLAEKRVWLTRRLKRVHRGDTEAENEESLDTTLAFVECDRNSDQLRQLRKQLFEQTGLGAADITGEFEVRFKDESSVGSAVTREWMDLIAQRAFLKPEHRLLLSYDHGLTFLPNPAATFLNPHWRGDYELLGRLLGLALWQQVTLDLPLHPYICELLLREGFPYGGDDVDAAWLERIDPELYRHKVRWLMSSGISELGCELLFTDTLLTGEGLAAESGNDEEAADESSNPGSPSSREMPPPLPPVISVEDRLPGDARGDERLMLRRFGPTEITLVPDGDRRPVSEENKASYVAASLQWRLRSSLEGPLEAMLTGFRAVMPSEVLAEARRMLSADEVHALLAGSRDIDVDDWERNSRAAGGLSTSSKEVRWFWQTVHQWAADGNQGRLQDLLQFATGSRRVPVGGFSQLVGFNGGKHLFTLVRGSHLTAMSLPTSHACICTIDLPPWESQEAAQQKLLAAAESGRARFDEHFVSIRNTVDAKLAAEADERRQAEEMRLSAGRRQFSPQMQRDLTRHFGSGGIFER